MPWVRLDEQFARHPKVVQAGPLALAMHVAALCYCNQYLTDGFLAQRVPRQLLDFDGISWWDPAAEERVTDQSDIIIAVVNVLIETGLWEYAEGGYRIHDYGEYQPTRADIQEKRAQKQAAGRAGGEATAKARTKHAGLPPTSANGVAKSKPGPVPEPFIPPNPHEVGEPDKRSPRAKGTNPRSVAAAQRQVEREAHEQEVRYINGVPSRLVDGQWQEVAS